MSTLTRNDFVSRNANKAIDVEKARETLAADHHAALKAADLNGDGQVAGAAELRKAFVNLDNFDSNGTRASVNMGTKGRPTAVGDAFKAIEQAATPRRGLSGSDQRTQTASSTAAGSQSQSQGVHRSISPFQPVDERRLQAALPDQAKHLAQAFIEHGRRHNIDPIALVAISKHETGNFTSAAFKHKHNAMGISDSRGPTMQRSAEVSIEKMAKHLADPNGYYAGKTTIGQIANVYAPVGASNDPRGLNNGWGKGVGKYADELAATVRL